MFTSGNQESQNHQRHLELTERAEGMLLEYGKNLQELGIFTLYIVASHPNSVHALYPYEIERSTSPPPVHIAGGSILYLRAKIDNSDELTSVVAADILKKSMVDPTFLNDHGRIEGAQVRYVLYRDQNFEVPDYNPDILAERINNGIADLSLPE